MCSALNKPQATWTESVPESTEVTHEVAQELGKALAVNIILQLFLSSSA